MELEWYTHTHTHTQGTGKWDKLPAFSSREDNGDRVKRVGK